MEESFILLYKKMVEWQWYKDANTFRLFIDLLLDANWKDSTVGFQEVKRGQCMTSLKRIHERTGLTYQEIRTSLGKLEISQEINKQTTNRYTVITINKYDDYQKCNKQLTNKQQTSNNIIINNNKVNNIKEKIYKKEKYGLFENVSLTDEEYQKLKDKFSDYEKRIDNLSSYIASKGDKYKSHYATILNWSRKDERDEHTPSWFNKEPEERKLTDEEQRQLDELIRGY